jgi:glycosyltransferase involved in cell wall biosynthesis
MHIAFLSSEYPPLPSGGIGTSVYNLAQALVRQGHRATVIGWGAPRTFEDRGVLVRFLEATAIPRMGWLINRRRAQHELNRMVREEGLDIVEAHDWCGISAGMRLGCPLVIRCNGSDTYFGHLLRVRVRPAVFWVERLALRQADAVAAVSAFTANVTRRLFGLRPAVSVLANGIDVAQFRPGHADESQPDLVLYVGTLARKKGVLDLCRSFSALVERHPAARLRLVGRDTPDQRSGAPSTWALCRALLSPAARARVEYLGPQPYATIQEHFRRAAICVFPSYAEACPLVWIEAMACAKPVVAYDIGWAPEIVDPQRTGVLVPAGDTGQLAATLARLLDDPTLRQQLGQAGRQRAEDHFAAQLVAARSVAWYQHVIEGQRG